MAEQKWILGVDGGGTKTTAILVAEDGTLGAEVHAGPSNLLSVGVDKVAELVIELARQCCAKIPCGPEVLSAVGIGLAGAGRERDRAEFRDRLLELSKQRGFPFTSVLIESDWRVTVEAAFPTSPGAVLIAGTGSIACARAEDGRFLRMGGWGRILGDEGSAYALSREALNAVLRFHEGRGEKTLLHEYAMQHFGTSTVDELVTRIYREDAGIASFATKVLVAESQRDTTAHAILVKATGELTDLLGSLFAQLQPKRRMPVALMGSLLEKENPYSTMVREGILSALPKAVVLKPKFPAAYGAAILALQPFISQR